jgi:hypothetical protein
MALDENDIQHLTELLSQLEVGKLPLPVFHELARLMVLPAVEVIPLFSGPHGETSVLLTQREPNDPIWPGQWHTPGRILRPNDVDGSGTYGTAIRNLVQAEFPGVRHGDAVYVETEFRTVARGAESAALHWVDLESPDTSTGQLFPVGDLPENIIDHHRPMIEKMYRHYSEHRSR